jgi:hypothetical protein
VLLLLVVLGQLLRWILPHNLFQVSSVVVLLIIEGNEMGMLILCKLVVLGVVLNLLYILLHLNHLVVLLH